MSMNAKDVKNSYDYIVELIEKRWEELAAFRRQILLMASALLGALLAFYRKQEEASELSWILFGSALAGIVLGILLLSVALYENTANLARLRKEVQRRLRNAGADGDPLLSSIESKPIFLVCAVTAYISFSLSLILFVVYVFI